MTGFKVEINVNESTTVGRAAAMAELAVRLWSDYKLGLHSNFKFEEDMAYCKVRAEQAAVAIMGAATSVGLEATMSEIEGGSHEFIAV
jgi:glycerol kinase